MRKALLYAMAIVVVALTVAFCIYESAQSFTVPISHVEQQDCLQAAQQSGEKKPDCPTHESVWERGMRDPVAQYTLWITWFTGVLTILGLAQWVLTYRQIQLSRDEFNATHRPEIIVHSVEYSTDIDANAADQLIGAEVTYFNRGVTDASDIVISGEIFSHDGRPLAGRTQPEILKRQRSIPGEPYNFGVFSNVSAISYALTRRLAADDGDADAGTRVYCIGTIAYSDKSGARRISGYCWRLHDKRWVRQSKSAYEYAY